MYVRETSFPVCGAETTVRAEGVSVSPVSAHDDRVTRMEEQIG